MNEPSEIIAVLAEAGIDSGVLIQTSQHPDVKNELLANTQYAHQRGAFGSPTFFIGNEIYFGKDRIREAEEEILRSLKDPQANQQSI
jgi:2-hydroxychromene-2-carboxylate isomerase